MNPAWRVALSLVALAAAVVPLPAAAIEQAYSQTTYLAMQARVTALSNRVPLALLDVVLAGIGAGWLAAIAVDIARSEGRWMRAAGRIVLRTAALVAGAYLIFLALWGLNYRRVPLADKLQFDRSRVSPRGAGELGAIAVDRVNVLYERAHASLESNHDGIDSGLADASARVQRDLGARRLARPGVPKHTMLDVYFRRAAVDGMTDPFFLETLVASDLLPFERPFVIAHEWSHLAGYADEGEANFVGWLTCVRAGEDAQYSAWLFLYEEILFTVSAEDRVELTNRLDPGPRADRRAVADRFRRNINPTLFAAGWTVYDRFLKANRVEAGAASYAEVVRLVLGTRFEPEWTPRLK